MKKAELPVHPGAAGGRFCRELAPIPDKYSIDVEKRMINDYSDFLAKISKLNLPLPGGKPGYGRLVTAGQFAERVSA